MRIAVIGMHKGANTFYRALNPARVLDDRGHTVQFWGVQEPTMGFDTLRGFDVVLIYRHCGEVAQQLAVGLKKAGVAIVYDDDDMVGNVTADHPHRRDFGGLRGVALNQRVRRMLRAAHIVTTPSPTLAAQYRETTDDVRVIENYVPDGFASLRRTAHEGIVVGWVAGPDHEVDRDRLRLRDTLDRLLSEHRDVRVVTVGVALGLDSRRYEHIVYVEFPELGAVIGGFDLGLAPLVDVPINRTRASSKVKEYAVLGVPWLASPVGTYPGLGEAEGGRLVADDDWYEAIERLVTHHRERRRLAKRAARWGRSQTIGKHAQAWEIVLQDAVERARAEA
ncbi:MAG TPA: glycosyltransferase [Conexibacter sp.]|nr:glycosyltransferase [Conexibacter sp.]